MKNLLPALGRRRRAGLLPLLLTLGAASSAQAHAPTVHITSPPTNISVVSGSRVSLAATVEDPNNQLAEVRFFLNNILVARAGSRGPFAQDATAPGPGT